MSHEWTPPGQPQDGTPAAHAPQEPTGPAAYGPPVPFGVHPHAPVPYPSAARKGTSPVVVGVVVAVAVVLVGMLVAGAASMALVVGTEQEVVVPDEADDPFEGLSGEPVAIGDLQVGDCFVDPAARGAVTVYDLTEVELVDCDEPHELEVVGLHALDEEPRDTVSFHDEVIDACDSLFYDYASAAEYHDWDTWMDYYWPTEEEWRAGDDGVTCVVGFDRPRTGSVAREDARA